MHVGTITPSPYQLGLMQGGWLFQNARDAILFGVAPSNQR